MGRGIKALICGGAIGAVLGILYAPRAGKKTRALLAEKTEALWGQEAQDKGTILGEVAKTTKTAVEAGSSIISEATKGRFEGFTKSAQNMGQRFIKDTSNFVGDFAAENVRPVFSEKNDELRKKIDTAREKIANQVARNIEGHTVKDVKASPSAVKTQSDKKPKAVKKSATKKTSSKKATTKKTDSKKNK